ncbi:MAG: feruloyl-CoA synthase [Deinococcales bacterium]
MKSQLAPYRQVHFGKVDTLRQDLPDGSILLTSNDSLGSYPNKMGEKLIHWAKVRPDHTFVAQRIEGVWQRLSYQATLHKVEALSQALLNRPLDVDRTIVILSENSLDHLLLALAAMHVGIPYSPISPPYALISSDFGKLRHCLKLMTPGLIFVSDGERYEKALTAVQEDIADSEIVFAQHPPLKLKSTPFAELLNTKPTPEVEAAFDRVSPDTITKVLFTSGSTAMPKGVINTQRMWCVNQEQIVRALPYMSESPPLFVDWLPWNHTFGSNHNVGLALYHGGSIYIDEGKPTPQGIRVTVENLRELSPTTYFNVPKGYEELVPYLRRDKVLRDSFFRNLQVMFYAGAAMAQAVWDDLESLSVESIGERVPIITSMGMTESAPAALFCNWSGGFSGLLGVPVPALELKLVPNDDKYEARYRGPNLTPGYWRQPELSASVFDEERFFRTGDAFKLVDPDDANKGLLFDGRIAEDFKLSSGTWVSVGNLRAHIVSQSNALIQDAVITGHNRDYLGAILFLNLPQCRKLLTEAGILAELSDLEVMRHPKIREKISLSLKNLNQQAGGSSNRIARATISEIAPSIDLGEITDKGSLNQRAILRHRAELVEGVYGLEPQNHILII